ncbi:MAG: hypothetical protein Q4B42_02900 [Oscillospiraceae bacterium]|nr:hypothetical protein [Oscillospiraceae bacterium]
MRLTPPTKAVLWISIIAGLLGLLFVLGVVPGVSAAVGGIVEFCALALLALACMIKGL